MSDLMTKIVDELQAKSAMKSAELALALGVQRNVVDDCLKSELVGRVFQSKDYRWRLVESGATESIAATPGTNTEISRFCRYYLDCLGHDMGLGVSVSADSEHYAELSGLPMVVGPAAAFSSCAAGRVLGVVRQDQNRALAWLGYPVLLRHEKAGSGLSVVPLFLWRVDVGKSAGDSPGVEGELPTLNEQFIGAVAMGDTLRMEHELAVLTEELGLDLPTDDFPDIEEIVARLQQIRPEWIWREPLDAQAVHGGVPLRELAEKGIYNRAILVVGERTPYTVGLETELRTLGDSSEELLRGTALGTWLGGTEGREIKQDAEPLLEVLPMNSEQRAAVQSALNAPHTVITGPPGTGKSQVVTNLLVNAAVRGMRVLFASKNNRAVDVVEERVNKTADRPVLLRLGAVGDQARLRDYLTNLLASNPGAEDQAFYSEGRARHRQLYARLVELDKRQQATVAARNLVDRLDSEAEDARYLFGSLAHGLAAPEISAAEVATQLLEASVIAANREKQPLFVRWFWVFLRGARLQELSRAVSSAATSASKFGLNLPDVVGESSVDEVEGVLHDWSARLAVSRKLNAFEQAVVALRLCTPLEDIAKERADLAEQMAENSKQLWEGWLRVETVPKTSHARKDIADYLAVLQLLVEGGSGQVHKSIAQKAKTLQAIVAKHFSCWGVTSLSLRGRVPFEPGYFDLVVIDEASQCDIASALPLLYRAKRSVIIGDPRQLRHISSLSKGKDSELQFRHGLLDERMNWMYSVSSLFDVATSFIDPVGIVALRDHHRSHADIIEFSNRTFYESRLRVATRYGELKRPPGAGRGVLWKDVRGKVVKPASGGAYNEQEAVAIVDAIEDLIVYQGFRGTVGVVTPFRAQAQLLQKILVDREALSVGPKEVQVIADTAHRFQGDERDVMFFSPVVSFGISDGALSFLRRNGNLFNVAITRARALLYVVGNKAAAESSGIDYLANFVSYVDGLVDRGSAADGEALVDLGAVFPAVGRPQNVSDWERRLYPALYAAGIRPIPQYSVDSYDLDFAVIVGKRKLDIEVDGERYHRAWTGELLLRDQLRNQRLIELGWDVKRFWVYQIRDDLQGCVDAVVKWVEEANG